MPLLVLVLGASFVRGFRGALGVWCSLVIMFSIGGGLVRVFVFCWVIFSFVVSFSFSNVAPCLEGGVMKEVLPCLGLVSLGVLDFVVPQAFGDGGVVALEDSEAYFFPCVEHFLGGLLLSCHFGETLGV